MKRKTRILLVALASTVTTSVTAFAGGQQYMGPYSLSLRPSVPVIGASLASINQDENAHASDESAVLAFGINYAIYSDYIFRGINFSEYAGEGREKLNHQVDAWVEVDLGLVLGQDAESLGAVTFGAWFEWYADQEKLDPDSGSQNLQEIDYYVSWAFDVDEVDSTLTLGVNFYTIPNAKPYNTLEWFFKLEHNDAWMWSWLWPAKEDGVLNPSFTYFQDLELTPGSGWMEFAFSHEFEVSDLVTLTPAYTIAIDHRYLDPVLETGKAGSTRLAYVQYGLNIDYDLSKAMSWSDEAGEWTVSGFLYFQDALGNPEHSRLIQDEFYGGVAIDWSF